MILEPLRSYLRYGHNGSCFVGFRGRLTLQTPRNVEGYRRNGLSGTQQGGPCPFWGSAMGWPSPCVCKFLLMMRRPPRSTFFPSPTLFRSRRFALLSAFPLVFGAFLEAPKSYQHD